MVVSERLVQVRWHDAAGVSENWQDVDALEDHPLEDYIIDSVGFVLRESETVLHIAPHLHSGKKNDQYCGDMEIPKSAILDIWEIR